VPLVRSPVFGPAETNGSCPKVEPKGHTQTGLRLEVSGCCSYVPRSEYYHTQDVSKRGLQWSSKCCCVASVTETFTLKGVRTICHSTSGKIWSIEKSNDLIGNRFRCLLACNMMPWTMDSLYAKCINPYVPGPDAST
jgi:hypothetical protein